MVDRKSAAAASCGRYRARRAWIGGISSGVGIRRACGRAQATGARQHRHPQRLCDDHGPDAGDIKNGDVHVTDGAIVAVGLKLKAPGATTIDGRGMIVLPGLVETHWHMWNTLLRSMSGEKADLGYFRTTATLGKIRAGRHVPGHAPFLRRSDQQRHHIRARLVPQHPRRRLCRADMRALRESGLRARFSYGAAQGMANKEGIDLADLERLHDTGRAFQRRPDFARPRLARHGRRARCPGCSASPGPRRRRSARGARFPQCTQSCST